MNLFAIVGPSGSGKTSVVNALKSYGIKTMEENYIGSYPSQFSNRELLSKWSWIARWIELVWDFKLRGTMAIVSDRCPLEVVPYATEGTLLLESLNSTMMEFQNHDIWIRTIYLRVPLQICFERCRERLHREQCRQIYGEEDLDYVTSIYAFYEKSVGNLWDFTIEASGRSIEEIRDEIKRIIDRNS